MKAHTKITFGLLAALLLMAPGEWPRAKEWYEGLSAPKQWAIGIAVALFLLLISAWLLWPLVWPWAQRLL